MSLRYPILIEAGSQTTAYGVVVPDLPGCFSAGDTLDEAIAGAEEAAAAWIDATLDAGRALPAASALDTFRDDPTYRSWTVGIIAIDPALLDDRAERINVTLPRRVLARLDALARAAGQTRSAYIAQLTLDDRRAA